MRKCKKLRASEGMTLVEVIVSFALLAIVLLVLSGAFLSAVNVLGHAQKQKKSSMSAAGKVELAAGQGAAGTAGTMTVQFGSTQVTVGGSYRTGTDSGVTYKSFTPGAGS